MEKQLANIKQILKEKDINKADFLKVLEKFLRDYVSKNQLEGYIGDFPTFIEPVYLGKNVTIGDDVLLGPNAYIGNNCIIGDYCEISNSIILSEVQLGSINKLDRCIIMEKADLNDLNNLSLNNCLLQGSAKTKDELDKKCFK